MKPTIVFLLIIIFSAPLYGQTNAEEELNFVSEEGGDFLEETSKKERKTKSTEGLNKISKKQLSQLNLYPKQNELYGNNSEAFSLLKSQFTYGFSFIIEAIYLGNNKSYIPGIVIKTQEKLAKQELIKIQQQLYELLRPYRYRRTKLRTFVYRKKELYSIITSQRDIDSIKVYSFPPLQESLQEQFETLKTVSREQHSKIRNHEIQEVFWFVMPHLVELNIPFSLLIISKDQKEGLHMSKMQQISGEWEIDYYGKIEAKEYGYSYLYFQDPDKYETPNKQTTQYHYIYTGKESLVSISENFMKLNDEKFLNSFFLKIK